MDLLDTYRTLRSRGKGDNVSKGACRVEFAVHGTKVVRFDGSCFQQVNVTHPRREKSIRLDIVEQHFHLEGSGEGCLVMLDL